MNGYLNGVAAQIQTDTPSALYIHCLAHCTNLCLQTIGHQCIAIRDALDLVMGVADLIRYSPKRSSLFEALQSQLLQVHLLYNPCVLQGGLSVLVHCIPFCAIILCCAKCCNKLMLSATMIIGMDVLLVGI